MQKKLWGGRFQKKIDTRFERFSASFRWDRRLLPYDLKIDAAHVKALKKCGVLSSFETKKLLSAIRLLERKHQSGSLKLKADSEDVHSAIQTEIERMAGMLAHKLHTARSRNDLVSQSSRLYCLDHADKIIALIEKCQRAILSKADEYQDLLIPGMTHLQNAQVLSQAHIFLAYLEMLERSKTKLVSDKTFMDRCVLGSGALAGVTFDLDQKMIAKELGLSRVSTNSYDVSGDRDYIFSFLSSMAFLGIQLSRIAEDLMIGQTKGFSLVDIDQSYCTGSSMMPQKKNADFVELARGASGILTGNLLGLMTSLKGLPSSYNRDLQWDKKYLFDSTELCEELLDIFSGVFGTLKIDQKNATTLLADENLYATDLADYLVQKGVAFKEAHGQVGQIVSFAEKNKVKLSKIGIDILKKFAPRIEGDVYDLFDAKHSVKMKKTIGSTNPAQVKNQIGHWKKKLKD